MLEINKIYNMDCLEGIKQIPIPNLIICDPPYQFAVTGGGLYNQKDLMNNIKIIDTNSFDFYKFIPKILDLQKDRVNAYFFCNKALLPNYLNEAVKRGLNFDVLVLRKLNPIPAKKSSYVPELEYIVFLRSKEVTFNSNLSLSNYKKFFNVTIGHSNLQHPNEKPIELIRRFIKISSQEKDLVLDCFIGSGTTAVASQQLDRNFMGFEINKEYYEISNKRTKKPKKWATLKGVCN